MRISTSQLQLTRSSDYAVRAMIHLATLREGERIMLPTLAKAIEVPGSFLSKVLQALTRARLISSKRGPSGGFAIADRGLQASIRIVIEAVEGPIQLNLCLQDGRSCSRKSWCPAHGVWARAQAAMLDVLNDALVADLAAINRTDTARIEPRVAEGPPSASGSSKPNPAGLVLLSR